MSRPSTANDPESCSSEGSSRAASSMPKSSPGDASKRAAPPPPPLPPPPPPPPATAAPGGRRKRRVRSFFWKPIPEEKVRGKPNIWTMAVRQQQFQIDVRSVEELFGQQEEAAGGPRGAGAAAAAPGAAAAVSRSRSFKESSKDEISILDSKRGMNVGIFLKQFKKSNRSIVEDIRRGEGKIYGAELLKDLLKLLPDAEEVKKLQMFKGDADKLTLVDSFMFLLIQVPRFEVRIEAMVLREEFFPSCAAMSHEIDVVRVATKELMSCEELHAILHLVLQAGNIMNAGGYAGNAVGFKLSSLLSLADTKANKPGMNLLHFVAMEAKKKDEKLLKFPERLQDVQSAARISVENIEMDFSSLYVRIKSLEEKVQGDQELLQQLEPFLQSSAQTLQELKRRRLDLRKEGNALIDFFCEDKDTFKLDECFRIFQDFCIKFRKAVKDNVDREAKEAARQRRLRELEERRFAWAAPDPSGAFGRSSSESDVELLSKDGLLDFLQRSQSPHGPLGRSASARRHRHTMTSVADRELQGFLQLFGGAGSPADRSRFHSLPRPGRPAQRGPAPWISAQDDNRELGGDRGAVSPCAGTDPVSPLVRFSSSGFADNQDACNNNQCSSLSEGSARPCSLSVFPKPAITGRMNVSVEKHTLARGPQAFDLRSPNNNSHIRLVDRGDVEVTDLEEESQPPPKNVDHVLHSKAAARDAVKEEDAGPAPTGEREEDASTVSSTTCTTPLPLDTSASSKKPPFYLLDCTETDCSVSLDYSEGDSSSAAKEGLGLRPSDRSGERRDPSALSSASPNDESASAAKPPDAASTEEWDTESCDTTEGRQAAEKDAQRGGRKAAHAKGRGKGGGGRGVRTLTSSESQGMRKVVPISRCTRAGGSKPPVHEGGDARRPLRDQSTPATGRSEKAPRPPRHSSLPPDGPKAARGGGSRVARDAVPRKPSGKPVRNVPKAPPEEKMCRSTMRALAQAQVQVGGASSEAGGSHTLTARNPADVPGFARNTVASSSRFKKEAGPPSVPSTPSRSPSLAGRPPSVKQSRPSAPGEEPPRGAGLRRAHSVRAAGRSRRSETPPPAAARDHVRKAGSFSEKSTATPGRGAKPSWK
ncbi:FH2 domain-containing protein 1 [Betta splendens]|uniref:FH2 domain-containing protein 1 n=1 Tax=Betta splendens TaxID=158456 RepID=A0A6P7N1E7_BETSP|nr:FH2 domain-containing protein 1 [Betta splendens]XP_029013254.1 FH2 domain-containing protein 1 [Betta splendens]